MARSLSELLERGRNDCSLALVVDETPPDAIRARLRRYSEAQIDVWLAKLEELHLLESVPMAPSGTVELKIDRVRR